MGAPGSNRGAIDRSPRAPGARGGPLPHCQMQVRPVGDGELKLTRRRDIVAATRRFETLVSETRGDVCETVIVLWEIVALDEPEGERS